METEEDRRAKLENDVATKRLRLAMETDEERKAKLEKMVSTTLLRLALETEEERRAKKKRNGFDLDLISKTFISRNEFARPVMGTIFLVYYHEEKALTRTDFLKVRIQSGSKSILLLCIFQVKVYIAS